jgi:hypothetical protein
MNDTPNRPGLFGKTLCESGKGLEIDSLTRWEDDGGDTAHERRIDERQGVSVESAHSPRDEPTLHAYPHDLADLVAREPTSGTGTLGRA